MTNHFATKGRTGGSVGGLLVSLLFVASSIAGGALALRAGWNREPARPLIATADVAAMEEGEWVGAGAEVEWATAADGGTDDGGGGTGRGQSSHLEKDASSGGTSMVRQAVRGNAKIGGAGLRSHRQKQSKDPSAAATPEATAEDAFMGRGPNYKDGQTGDDDTIAREGPKDMADNGEEPDDGFTVMPAQLRDHTSVKDGEWNGGYGRGSDTDVKAWKGRGRGEKDLPFDGSGNGESISNFSDAWEDDDEEDDGGQRHDQGGGTTDEAEIEKRIAAASEAWDHAEDDWRRHTQGYYESGPDPDLNELHGMGTAGHVTWDWKNWIEKDTRAVAVRSRYEWLGDTDDMIISKENNDGEFDDEKVNDEVLGGVDSKRRRLLAATKVMLKKKNSGDCFTSKMNFIRIRNLSWKEHRTPYDCDCNIFGYNCETCYLTIPVPVIRWVGPSSCDTVKAFEDKNDLNTVWAYNTKEQAFESIECAGKVIAAPSCGDLRLKDYSHIKRERTFIDSYPSIIAPQCSIKVFDIKGGSVANGAPLALYPFHGAQHQIFYSEEGPSFNDGGKLYASTCNREQANQRFLLQPYGDFETAELQIDNNFCLRAHNIICKCDKNCAGQSATTNKRQISDLRNEYEIIPYHESGRTNYGLPESPVRLQIATSGGMKCLDTKTEVDGGIRDPLFGRNDLQHDPVGEFSLDKVCGNNDKQGFYLTPMKDQAGKFLGKFLLKTVVFTNRVSHYIGSVCLKSEDSPGTLLSVAKCEVETSPGSNLLWKIVEGRLMSDGSGLCLTQGTKVFMEACDQDDQYVSIIPYDIKIEDYQRDDRLEDIFPTSGIPLFGDGIDKKMSLLAEAMTTNPVLAEDSKLDFKFAIDGSVGEKHQVCLDVVSDSTKTACLAVAGNAYDLDSLIKRKGTTETFEGGKINEYEVTLSEVLGDIFQFDNSEVVQRITFQQQGSSGSSRFFSISLYSGVQATLVQRFKDQLEMKLVFPISTSNDDLEDLWYNAKVMVQDAEGSYLSEISAASKRLSFAPTDKKVTVSSLPPGRRFLITLNPVDSSGQAKTGNAGKLKAVFKEYTSCSCGPGTDQSGSPEHLSLTQSNGYIQLSFKDQSVCEEAYGMTRQRNGQEGRIAFSPPFFYFANEDCKEDLLTPGNDYQDIVKNLEVGESYTYCVSAVAKKYMINHMKDDGRFVGTSEPACSTIIVEWESYVVVKTTLKREAGGVPVDKVNIRWQLLNPKNMSSILLYGDGVTGRNGELNMNILLDPQGELTGDDQLALKMFPQKSTEDVTHRFLCDDEQLQCDEENGYVVYIRHLGKTVVHFADSSTIPMSGTVFSSQDENQVAVCPLSEVEVCLNKKRGINGQDEDTVVECKETDKEGKYILYATVGTRVYPEVKLDGHTFKVIDQAREEKYTKGLEASFDALRQGSFSDHDFYDTTTTSLNLMVAGGVCNLFLGNTTIEVEIDGCGNYKQVITHTTVKGFHKVPAHKLKVAITNVMDNGLPRQHVIDTFDGDIRRIDLTEVNAMEDERSSAENETRIFNDVEFEERNGTNEEIVSAINTTSHVRFQYNGVMNIKPEIEGGKDLAGQCSRYKVDPNQVWLSSSFHVVQTNEKFDLTLYLRQLILPDKDLYCDKVDSSTRVKVVNEVGLVETLTDAEKNLLEKLKNAGIDTSRYTSCTKDCSSLKPDKLPEEETKSKLKLQLQAGIPKFYETEGEEYPFSKTIVIQSGDARHTMNVVIVGDYSDGPPQSLSVPTHEPLLIIRDPPGGSSSVTYSNVQTTMKITSEHYEKYTGWDAGAGLSKVFKGKASVCAGLGVELCAPTLETNLEIGATIDSGSVALEDLKDESHSHALTVTWSYSTSQTASYAGKDSDVFLVPTIAIIFRTTETISFNETLCQAIYSKTIKFDLGSQDNRSPISFWSYRHVNSVLIPELKKKKDDLERDNRTSTDDERLEEIKYQFPVIKSSLEAWADILQDYEEVNEKAVNKNLENVGKWFSDQRTERLCLFRELPITETLKIDKLDMLKPLGKLFGIDSDIIKAMKSTWQFTCSPPDSEPRISNVCEDFPDPALRPDQVAGDCILYNILATDEGINEFAKLIGDPLLERWGVSIATISLEALPWTNWTELPPSHVYWKMYEFRHPQLHNSDESISLVSDKLASGAKELESTKSIVSQVTSYEAFDSTGSIQFSGGGGLLTLTFDDRKMDRVRKKWNIPNGNLLFSDSDNRDNHGMIGIDANGGIEAGAGILAGIKAGIHGDLKFSTSNRMSSDYEKSESTSITVTFGDPDVGDQFLVDMMLDPNYGTIVFAVVEGKSKCPCETEACMENPLVKVVEMTKPDNFVPNDELMVFELELSNQGFGFGSFDLYADKLDNSDGLEISVDGLNVNTPSPWALQGTKNDVNPGKASIATLTVRRGPRSNSYDPVTIYLKSTCDFRAKHEVELYNVDEPKGIMFTEPCLEVQWDGALKKHGDFRVNRDSPHTLLVTIFNPRYRRMSMGNITRLEKISLEYKKLNDWKWEMGTGTNDQAINFKNTAEDSFGYATASWKIPDDDAVYELRLKSTCESSQTSPERLNEFISSTSIIGLVDREPPAVFGVPTPPANLHPGQALTIEFTEELNCEIPHSFIVKLQLSGLVKQFDNDDLDIICSGNSVRLQFKEGNIPARSYRQLLGRHFNLTMNGIEDKSGNVMDHYEFSSNFVCSPPNPKLEIIHTAGMERRYLPHESMVFEAHITNDGEDWAVSPLELGVVLATNNKDFSIFVNGAPLIDSQTYFLEGKQTITTDIAIAKGPGKQLKFSPISIFLRSDCVQDGHDPVQVTADLWNWQDTENYVNFIRFTPPCPPIRWAGIMRHTSRLMLNANTLSSQGSLLEVSLFNEEYADRRLFDLSVHNTLAMSNDLRLRDVVLLYQHAGDWNASSWKEGQLVDLNGGQSVDGRSVEFSMASIEDKFGFSSLYWNVSALTDSTYKVKITSRCTKIPDAHDELNSFSTDAKQVTIDKIPPAVYGDSSLQSPNQFNPDQEFVITFTEKVNCEPPFIFDLKIYFVDQAEILENNNGIYVKCEDDSIKYRLNMDWFMGDNFGRLSNTPVRVELVGVKDLAGNDAMPVVYETSYAHWNFSSIVKHQGCNGVDDNYDGNVDDCSEDQSPPIIVMSEAVTAYERDDGVTIIDTAAFSSLVEAGLYLKSIVKAEDDCATDLFITISSPPFAGCSNTVFTVTVTDPRCTEVNTVQTVSKDFALLVDEMAPSVSAGFFREAHPSYFDQEGLYLHIDENDRDYENTLFSYEVTDNCPTQTKVEVTVLSNEFSYSNLVADNMVLIREKEDVQQSEKLQIFVEPNICIPESGKGNLDAKALCDWDTQTPPFRFYQIRVEATDRAGNTGDAKATVIIIPKNYRSIFRNAPGFSTGTSTFFVDMVKRTTPRYVIQTKEVQWEHNKKMNGAIESVYIANGQVNVVIVERISFSNADISDLLDQEQMGEFLSSFIEVLQNVGCPESIQKCNVNIRSVNGQSTRNIRFRQVSRRLQTPTSDILFEYIIEAKCFSGCDDASAAASALYDQTIPALLGSIENGELADRLRDISSDAATILTDTVTLSAPGAVTDAPLLLSDWYPDLRGGSGRCKNDRNVPEFMQGNDGWLEDSLKKCCKQHFSDTYYVCMGDSIGRYYPDWDTPGSIKCIESAHLLPGYMRQSPGWVFDDIESCCERYYSWVLVDCIVQSGGEFLAATSRNEWYLDWENVVCKQSCVEGAEAVRQGLNCGGVAKTTDHLYATVEDCCKKKLHWIALPVCIADSSLSTPATGTQKWYVSHTKLKCVQDCPEERSGTCGGVVRDAYVTLFESPVICCKNKLGWIESELCVVHSINADSD